jgi:hypothetical protein
MTKLSIAIAFLTVVIAAGGNNASKQMAPQATPSIFPMPICPPACVVTTPSQLPN